MKRQIFLRNLLLGSIGLLSAKGSIKSQSNLSKDYYNNTLGYNHLPGKMTNKMKYVIHRSESRGHANHGWLDARHSFSFASYYNPERMQFGALRVVNDDKIAGGQGFGMHPHDNMEIITIPLEGDLRHKDNMGNTSVIKQGEIQVMSAGRGIRHSEYNENPDKDLKLLQIWVLPHTRNVEPRYDQIKINTSPNNFHQILSPAPADEGVWIHQNAWFYLGDFDHHQKHTYTLKGEKNGVYVFVVEGKISIDGNTLNKRDAMAIYEANEFEIDIEKDSQILLMEVPMVDG